MNWILKLLGLQTNSINSSKTRNIVYDYEMNLEKINEAGSIDGKHYTTYVDQVKKLKHEKRHKEVIDLLLKLVNAVEKESIARENDDSISPWYYEQLAIIYRKEKRYKDEIYILERYVGKIKNTNNIHPKIVERLKKAKGLIKKIN